MKTFNIYPTNIGYLNVKKVKKDREALLRSESVPNTLKKLIPRQTVTVNNILPKGISDVHNLEAYKKLPKESDLGISSKNPIDEIFI